MDSRSPKPAAAAATPAPGTVDLAPLRRASRPRWPELAVWLLPVAAWFLFPEDLALLTQIAIMAIFALSLDLVLGYAGIVTLGHAAFFGVGAYAAGLLAAKLGIGDPLLGLLFAAAVAALAGLVTAPTVLRGTGLTRLMVTIGIGMMLFEAANKATDLTGGVDGLQGIEMTPILGLWSFDLWGKTAYVYAVVVLLVLFLVARRIVHSPFGLSLRALHMNPARMPALGVSVDARLAAAWVLGATYAGIAGALLTQTTQFVSIDVLGFERSAEILLILVLGGAGRLYGALIGTIVFVTLHHVLAGIDPEYWQMWIGLVLIGIVLFARNGIMGAIDPFERLLARKKTEP
ncbi:branched-chain amino acid ABC transporter permease [Rhodoplanes sp. TEM]|uniref:Branched-chain amino acid ABC transporter permease n=1 Tax=Rhodoplanes tepidamans TaxID=200616 RepID=A0ABT5J330_RHOTP|nr:MULTISPECIES: branched-chain amino acid ABC transporter permease [Rhodoplanes]MDC7784090.1 branched-chain amino acid ABC transporter permease [Rhodoplanes tepidamans]MDC7983185.1 branched-chain amino acid ABC transporter permease [Rhodoplanes sp. TEM]MDQ0356813.1 branched-chain amino acid transport system permease protein [Rhodoplanes tepidamans]